jgi:hypothetical protein
MTAKIFSQALRRGLGGAIVELMNGGNGAEYRDVVLRCCLRDIAHDTQIEGTKGYFLHTAIKTFGEPEIFLRAIAEKFAKRLRSRLSEQLCDILFCFSGNEIADKALEKKYIELKNRLPLMRTYRLDYCERELFEDLMIKKLDGGMKAFKRCINDMGEMTARRGNDDCLNYDWFFYCANKKFGEARVNAVIEKMSEKSVAVKFFSDAIKSDDSSREQYRQKAKKEKITVELLINVAKDAALADNPYSNAIIQYRHHFMKTASKAEILELANAALREENETAKRLLLILFRHKPFPLEISPLLQYAMSENELLAEAAFCILEEIKDERIHDTAVTLLKSKGVKSLCLLKNNYKKSDDEIIYAAIKKSERIPQDIQSDINDIYLRNRSADAFPALLRVYQKGECSHCRHDTVKAMEHCGVLPNSIVEECLYDSFEETRKLAERLVCVK